VCGDSTTTEAVDAALAGVKPHLMVTDPPYGVSYDPGWRVAGKAEGKLQQRGGGGKNSTGLVGNDDRADWHEAWALSPSEVAYVWCASMFIDAAIASLESVGYERRAQIIWAKEQFAIGRGNYHWQHEPCWYVVRKGATAHWGGARDQATLWKIVCNNGFRSESVPTGHSTQKSA
jgi:DNA modification methylase